jgi:Aldo/keto reductase family
MKRRTLGASGIGVSAIGLGCWGMSGSYGPADEAESMATLHHALDLGVDFIDTADSYGEDGHNEALIGRTLAGRRHEFVLPTKTGWVRRAGPDGKEVVGVVRSHKGRRRGPDRARTSSRRGPHDLHPACCGQGCPRRERIGWIDSRLKTDDKDAARPENHDGSPSLPGASRCGRSR